MPGAPALLSYETISIWEGYGFSHIETAQEIPGFSR
jgi:hypothetical protein